MNVLIEDYGVMNVYGMFRSYQEINEYFDKYSITKYLGNTKENVHPGMLIIRMYVDNMMNQLELLVRQMVLLMNKII